MFATNFDECIELIKKENNHKDAVISYLEEENKKLKDEAYKDEELQSMKEQLEKMKKDYWRGFPISEEEDKSIKEWQKKHETEVHGLITEMQKMKSYGVSGGRYSYHFVPTALGTSGVVRCSCGAEFKFQEIG